MQDAREYFQHLLEVMTRAERASMQRLGQANQPPTADVFTFELEDRIQCMESSRLSYKRSLTNVLAMDIPVDAATNKDELEDFQVHDRACDCVICRNSHNQHASYFEVICTRCSNHCAHHAFLKGACNAW